MISSRNIPTKPKRKFSDKFEHQNNILISINSYFYYSLSLISNKIILIWNLNSVLNHFKTLSFFIYLQFLSILKSISYTWQFHFPNIFIFHFFIHCSSILTIFWVTHYGQTMPHTFSGFWILCTTHQLKEFTMIIADISLTTFDSRSLCSPTPDQNLHAAFSLLNFIKENSFNYKFQIPQSKIRVIWLKKKSSQKSSQIPNIS